jgi:hypothetical protein
MTLDPHAVVRLLERIERHSRLDVLCYEFDNGVAKAFRQDIRSLGWLLKSCPDLMTTGEIREALVELRKRYLVVPSEFQDLIDQALAEIERLPGVRAAGQPRTLPARRPSPSDELQETR